VPGGPRESRMRNSSIFFPLSCHYIFVCPQPPLVPLVPNPLSCRDSGGTASTPGPPSPSPISSPPPEVSAGKSLVGDGGGGAFPTGSRAPFPRRRWRGAAAWLRRVRRILGGGRAPSALYGGAPCGGTLGSRSDLGHWGLGGLVDLRWF
jgi:hypothetical protein